MNDTNAAIVADLCARLIIHSECRLSVDGVEPDVAALARSVGPLVEDLGGAAPSDDLTLGLWALLYQGCYTHGRRLRADLAREVAADCVGEFEGWPKSSLRDRLATIAIGTLGWDRGWEVYQLEDSGLVRVRKGGRHRHALAGDYTKWGPPGVPVRVGGRVDLRLTVGSFELQAGYYHVLGSELGDALEDIDCARLYFNTRADSVEALLRALVDDLERAVIPFHAKTPASADHYARADATVLYVPRKYAPIVIDVVADLAGRDALLDPEVPLFSAQLFAGVGLADDPGPSESFGTHRCRLLAEALVDVWRALGPEAGQDLEHRLRAIRAAFSEQGLDLDRPHLGPGLRAVEAWPRAVEVTS
ncbi:T3SS effector HopA1 family protein [Enhygromyxa salina]|uniref:Uncharacterized protein n=1 Tax=Enhygromyxa salina TaxID=215803 RepID=A0A2S9YSW6_9BACT|nr:T3SS effector HopA1 family protein [Enhygromyxa salina]PRQ08183.1 hypothetical protein ENSA7_21550 [Enhygromyxa salina]